MEINNEIDSITASRRCQDSGRGFVDIVGTVATHILPTATTTGLLLCGLGLILFFCFLVEFFGFVGYQIQKQREERKEKQKNAYNLCALLLLSLYSTHTQGRGKEEKQHGV